MLLPLRSLLALPITCALAATAYGGDGSLRSALKVGTASSEVINAGATPGKSHCSPGAVVESFPLELGGALYLQSYRIPLEVVDKKSTGRFNANSVIASSGIQPCERELNTSNAESHLLTRVLKEFGEPHYRNVERTRNRLGVAESFVTLLWRDDADKIVYAYLARFSVQPERLVRPPTREFFGAALLSHWSRAGASPPLLNYYASTFEGMAREANEIQAEWPVTNCKPLRNAPFSTSTYGPTVVTAQVGELAPLIVSVKVRSTASGSDRVVTLGEPLEQTPTWTAVDMVDAASGHANMLLSPLTTWPVPKMLATPPSTPETQKTRAILFATSSLEDFAAKQGNGSNGRDTQLMMNWLLSTRGVPEYETVTDSVDDKGPLRQQSLEWGSVHSAGRSYGGTYFSAQLRESSADWTLRIELQPPK